MDDTQNVGTQASQEDTEEQKVVEEGEVAVPTEAPASDETVSETSEAKPTE